MTIGSQLTKPWGLFIVGCGLMLTTLFLPAISPFGAWTEPGWVALRRTAQIGLATLNATEPAQWPQALLALTAVAANFIPIASAQRILSGRINRLYYFVASLAVLAPATLAALTVGARAIQLRYGFWLWLLGIAITAAAPWMCRIAPTKGQRAPQP